MNVFAALVLACCAPAAALGQWAKVPAPKVPRTPAGQVDLHAPAPRTPDGKPDLTGPWSSDDNRYARDFALEMKPEEVPHLPWSREVLQSRKDGAHSAEDPDAHCLPQGVPKIGALAYPWKMVRTGNSYVVIYEAFTLWRQIFTDGREVEADAQPTWMGYSTGHWEGDEFVVETRGFNGRIWLDQLGRPTTEKMRVTERFRRVDFGNMTIDVTVDDPGAYTKPLHAHQEVHLTPGWEPLEFICAENNKDVEHLPGRK